MACFSPLCGFQAASGKVVKQYIPNRKYMEVPCGQCIGCRIDRSREWALRCVHEAQMHEANSFVTLTYSDDHLPEDAGLHKDHHQKFLKRLRKEFGVLRYFLCGEYGEKLGRPHYHVCLFGIDFIEDRYPWRNHNGNVYYRSPTLERIWPFGHSDISDLNWRTAAYAARYIMKKVNGPDAEAHYEKVDPETGEIFNVQPEYVAASNRPGLGYDWFQKYKSDVYPKDFIVHDGQKNPVPRYYDRLLERENPELLEELKSRRQASACDRAQDQTPARLKAREEFKERQIERLKRTLQ